MALDHQPMERAVLRRRLLIGLVVAAAIVVVTFAASVAFGWTLPAGTDFTITTDPAGTLPF